MAALHIIVIWAKCGTTLAVPATLCLGVCDVPANSIAEQYKVLVHPTTLNLVCSR